MAFQLNSGNVADASIAETLSKVVFGKLFGDKGYIPKQLSNRLLKQGLERLTTLRSNRKQKLMNLTEKKFRNKLSLKR